MGMPDDLKDLPEVKSVEVLRLNPGDSIVIKSNHRMSEETVTRIREMFQTMHGGRFKDVPVIVLADGLDIEVLRKS